jgi:phytoene desaturase
MQKTVAIIGGGVGALSGAIRLARKGFRVKLFEKNERVGGKMNEHVLTTDAGTYRFDTGPSLLTMPFVIDELFAFAGVERSDYLDIMPINPICRYVYPDGSVLDAGADTQAMMGEIERFSSRAEAEQYARFLNYTQRIYDLTAEIFLFTPFQEWRNVLKSRHLAKLLRLPQIDPFRSVHASVERFFTDKRLVQLFDRYATYNGSNPFEAPATLNVIPWVELGLGGFYIRGGMYRLVEQMEVLARGMGVEINVNAEVERVVHDGQKARGVRVAGEDIHADYVLCNADVVEAHSSLIEGFAPRRRSLSRLEPSVSGMVFLWGMSNTSPRLAHHNIIFSSDYKREFTQIFKERRTPDEPTIYVSITSKTDAAHAPAGHENWFVLLNMPYLSGQDWTCEVERMREATLRGLQAVGINAEPAITTEAVITPEDFYHRYRSNKGSIYGISSNTRVSAFLRPINRSRQLQGLYFCGGSSHPGGGVPLVMLSGKMAAELIVEDSER